MANGSFGRIRTINEGDVFWVQDKFLYEDQDTSKHCHPYVIVWIGETVKCALVTSQGYRYHGFVPVELNNKIGWIRPCDFVDFEKDKIIGKSYIGHLPVDEFPFKFLKWNMENQIPLHQWCNDPSYQKYVRYFNSAHNGQNLHVSNNESPYIEGVYVDGKALIACYPNGTSKAQCFLQYSPTENIKEVKTIALV